MGTLVAMNGQGRLTVPAAARQALRIDGPTQFELEITEDALILRPAIIIPREDAWAYTAEHLQRVGKARRDAAEGRTRPLTEEELDRIAARPS